MTKIETQQERNRRVRAQCEIVFSGLRVKRGANALGFLGELFDPVAILQYIGGSQEIRENIAAVEKAASINQDFPMIPPKERALNRECFDVLSKRLRHLEQTARRAEETLTGAGCRFDPATRKITITTGGKPAHLLTRWIQALSVEYGTNAEGREKIKNHLSNIINDELDDGPRGNIQRAIEKLREPSKR